MGLKEHRFVGLSKPVLLPDDIEVIIDIVPASVYNVRSNQKRAASAVTSTTFHETANYREGADARMHRNYLHNVPRDQYGNLVYVGFNIVIDDRRIIQLTPFDEVTWAAGIHAGNLTSDHVELCVHAGIDHGKARRNAAAFHAGLLDARGLTVNSMVQHSRWIVKDCPQLIRRHGLWATQINMTSQFMLAIKEWRSGNSGVVPQPDMPANGFKKGMKVITTDALNLRQGSGTSYRVTAVLQPGTGAEIIDGPRSANGYVWYDIKGSFGTGWVASNWLQVVPDKPEPSPAWPYPDPIMPVWWSELMSGNYIVDSEFSWFNTGGANYEVLRDTPRFRLAGGKEHVGPVLKKGEIITLPAVGQAWDKKHYGITNAGTRVLLDDLRIVLEG